MFNNKLDAKVELLERQIAKLELSSRRNFNPLELLKCNYTDEYLRDMNNHINISDYFKKNKTYYYVDLFYYNGNIYEYKSITPEFDNIQELYVYIIENYNKINKKIEQIMEKV